MRILITATYLATIGGALWCAYREMKLREELTEDAIRKQTLVSDIGAVRGQMARERLLRELPQETMRPYKRMMAMKFGFVALLVVEVILFNR